MDLYNVTLAAEPSAFTTWVRNARVGGAAVWVGMTDAEMNTLLNNLAAQNVSVIEADSDLSNYLNDAEFEQELALMRTLAQKAHAHANKFKVVWYYPSLEVLTPNASSTPNTMAKNHPDWVQWGIDLTKNVFIGGSGQVFWVDPGMESAWMSPSSPYRDYFYARVARIAKETGVDGLWADVPIYSDFGPVRWADANPYAAGRFESDEAGAKTPLSENWASLDWRRWIAWRHQELRRFLSDAAAAARKDNPEFAFIVETLPTDYSMSTVYGLEGVDLRSIEGVTHVWEVDSMSNNSANRKAREDDWISYISMQKYIKAASGNKPAWSFAYGKQTTDAELVLAEILAAGNNPYELKVPQMTTTVGAAYRTKVFGWIKANESDLWRDSAARVAVLYSPPSRDFVDQAKGEYMYVTTTAGSDSLFWNDDPTHSAYQSQYVAEYRGMIKLLVHNHVPFNSVIKPANASELHKYQVVIAPNLQALSNAEASILDEYVRSGGHLIITGPNPGGLDEYGTSRGTSALASVLPLSGTRYFSQLLGKSYFTNAADASSSGSTLLAAINAASTPWLTTTADRRLHMELSQADNRLILQYTNFIGVNGTFTITPTTASTTLNIPPGKAVDKVELTSPDNATPARTATPFTNNTNGSVTFSVPVIEYSMAVVTLKDTGPVANRPPVAGNDTLTTTQGTAVVFTANQLLLNDSDPDGDPLTISSVSTPTAQGGTVTGAYTYNPAAGFTGTDSFTYTVSDGKGGSATGTVTVTVNAVAANNPPVAVSDSYSANKDTALAVAAKGVLANDSDTDGNALAAVLVSSPSHGTLALNGDGGFTYAPTAGYTGPDAFTYKANDGQADSNTATVSLNVSAPVLTPATYYPQAATVTMGVYDWGSMASLRTLDSDTYDVNSAFVVANAGGVTDWYATTTMSGPRSAATKIVAAYTGQYSKASVSQQVYLYNFDTSTWDQVDTRTVGTSEVTVTVTVSSNVQRYISVTGELRMRLRGFRAGAQSTTAWKFFCWANRMSWQIQ